MVRSSICKAKLLDEQYEGHDMLLTDEIQIKTSLSKQSGDVGLYVSKVDPHD